MTQVFPILGHNRFAQLMGYDFTFLNEFANRVEEFYAEYPHKKTGRLIEEPREPLKEIQSRIYNNLLKHVDLPENFYGSVQGKTPYLNASVHTNKPVILKIDLKKCFRNISHHQVYRVWRDQLGCSPTVARIATRLTTFQKHLPTGASTSPVLANLVLTPAVQELSLMCQASGLKNTQYIDDANISGDLISDALSIELRKVFTRAGLKINREKTMLLKWGRGQIVTGYSAKKELPRLSKAIRSKIRSEMHHLSLMPANVNGYEDKYRAVRGRLERLKIPHPSLYSKYMATFANFVKPNSKGQKEKTKSK